MTDDALGERMAKAMNKSRFYDAEPEMYKDLEEFWARQYPEHVDEAEFMARAALAAIRSGDDLGDDLGDGLLAMRVPPGKIPMWTDDPNMPKSGSVSGNIQPQSTLIAAAGKET